MSGSTLMLSESSEELENKWNPLQCHVCHEQYNDPCILQCYHSFCKPCLDSKTENGKVICPLCGVDTIIKEDCQGPPSDALLKFLVESSSGDKTACANCDEVQSQMYFCNTCSQSLCILCREETHQAKMFLTHEIVLQTKHTRDIQKQCNIHNEPFILFSTEKKVMLCINCFRDMKVESRSHCVDLETAYKQGCQKLDDTMQSIRDLQSSVRDSILLLRALLEEIETNVEKEKTAIQELYDTMQEKITEMRETLLKEIDRQYDEKEDMFKKQLVSLTSFLPTLHVHLVTCAAFSSSANKYEFLDFTYVLMKRLMSIIQVQHPLHPSETSDIITDFKSKFARCLEPLLFPHRNGIPVSLPNTIVPSVACTRYDVSPCVNSPAISSVSNGQVLQGSQSSNKSKQNKKKYKLKLMETKGFFSDHCKEFDTAHREFMQKVDSLKQSVQELQRDITLRRSLTKEASMNELTGKISETEELLELHQGNVEGKRGGLEKHWEESLEKIAAEQEVYQAQLQDVGRLKSEVASVKVILQKLTSFMTSIASVTQRLAPKLRTAAMTAEKDSTHAAILQEINTMQPDSQQRVDAISRAQEVRDFRSANRVNPLDEELVKTKGLLRSPSLRKESTIKRLSAEIKETKNEGEEKDKDEKGSEEKESTGIESINKDSLENERIEKVLIDKINAGNDSVVQEKASDSSVKEPIVEIKVEQSDYNFNLNELLGTIDCNDKTEVKVVKTSQQDNILENGNDKAFDSKEHSEIKEELDTVIETSDLNGNNCLDVIQLGNISKDIESKSKIQNSSNDIPIAASESKLQKDKCNEDIDIETDTSTQNEYVKPLSDNEELSAEFNVEVRVEEVAVNESDLNTSADSSVSGDDSVKPGLVKDLVAMVDGRAKEEPSDLKLGAGSISPKLKCALNENVGNGEVTIENNNSNASMDIKDIKLNESSDTDLESMNDMASTSSIEGSPQSKNLSDTLSRSSSDQASVDDDEVYVTKSLPELAQVFEPGELKQKRKRNRSAKSKNTSD